jgi:hypothetical protein
MGDAIYTSTYLLDPWQRVEAVDIHNLLDLVFENFTDLKSSCRLWLSQG